MTGGAVVYWDTCVCAAAQLAACWWQVNYVWTSALPLTPNLPRFYRPPTSSARQVPVASIDTMHVQDVQELLSVEQDCRL